MKPRIATAERLVSVVSTLLLFIANAATAETGDSNGRLGGSVTLASDFVFRGVSQTMGRPALQLSIDAQLDRGLYAYVWGSNVDFHPDSQPDDDARHEVDLAIGFAKGLGSRWSVDMSVVRYLFPGTKEGIDYDYTELLTTLWYEDTLGATVAFAKDVDGSSGNGWLYELSGEFELPHELAAQLAYGYYDLEDAHGAGYPYARAAISRHFDSSSLSLAFNNASGAADDLYYEQAGGSRFVLSLQFYF